MTLLLKMQDDRLSVVSKDGKSAIERPEIPSRGYYSEIITNVDYGCDVDAEGLVGCQKKTNFLWQVKTEKHAPTITKLIPPKNRLNLKDAERWMTFDEDDCIVSLCDVKFQIASFRFQEFSVDTFKPKVQLQLVVYPFEMTRSVATERLRRAYQAKNIKNLLDALGIQPSDMVSLQLLEQYHPDKVPRVNVITNYLPLELFDDEEYDCR